MRYTIKNRWTDAVLFEGDFDTMALCVAAAVKASANLFRADLSRACLSGADLRSANLFGADLGSADLFGADLSRACLSGADLRSANLFGADLGSADLNGADLNGADLSSACLSGAVLRGADLNGAVLNGAVLRGADLSSANLRGAKWRDGFTLNRSPVRVAQRSDGYTFYLLDTDHGWRISAGCRFFSPDEAWKHWERTRPEDNASSLGAETRDILTMFELAMERESR